MTWLLTASGATFDLRFIAAANISLLDIAHHLAQINRFTGACARPYSVAEHSLLVCQLLEHAGYTNPALLQAALMHDAHEAYTSDMSSPMKQVLGNAWAAEENRIQHSVLRRFGCYTAFTAWRTPIHNADMQALATERAQLLPPGGPEWPVTASHPPAGWIDLTSRAAFTWLDWRQAFLDKFAELQYARSLQVETTA